MRSEKGPFNANVQSIGTRFVILSHKNAFVIIALVLLIEIAWPRTQYRVTFDEADSGHETRSPTRSRSSILILSRETSVDNDIIGVSESAPAGAVSPGETPQRRPRTPVMTQLHSQPDEDPGKPMPQQLNQPSEKVSMSADTSQRQLNAMEAPAGLLSPVSEDIPVVDLSSVIPPPPPSSTHVSGIPPPPLGIPLPPGVPPPPTFGVPGLPPPPPGALPMASARETRHPFRRVHVQSLESTDIGGSVFAAAQQGKGAGLASISDDFSQFV